MYRNSQILYETGDYIISSYNDDHYSINIYLNSNLASVLNKIPCPYIKVYINTNGKADSITSKMCRLSLLEPKYLGYEYEDLIFSDIEKSIFVEFLSKDDYKEWKNIIFNLYRYFGYDKIYTEYLPMPDYNNLCTFEDVSQHKITDPVIEFIYNYHFIRETNLLKFYNSLKLYNSNIIHKSNMYIYTLDINPYRFRVYDMKDFNNTLDDSPYRLYDIRSESFIQNEFYSDINDNVISMQCQYTCEICNINLYHFDFVFSIYNIIILLISAKLDLPIDKLIHKI